MLGKLSVINKTYDTMRTHWKHIVPLKVGIHCISERILRVREKVKLKTFPKVEIIP